MLPKVACTIFALREQTPVISTQAVISTFVQPGYLTSIATGTAPFTGSYKPESPLSVYNGKAPNGTWKLNIADAVATDAGTLNAWSIDVQTLNYTCNVYSSLVVTENTDDGTGNATGSLSKALKEVPANGEITFNLTNGPTITISGALPTVPDGVTINGGSCQSLIEIKPGNGLPIPTNGLTIGNTTNLIALYIHGFSGSQLKMSGTGNKTTCVKLSKI